MGGGSDANISKLLQKMCDLPLFACVEFKIVRMWPTSLGFYFLKFSLCPKFLFFLLLQQWLTFYWACFQFKKLWESVIKMSNFGHGVAMFGSRKFYLEFHSKFCAFLCIIISGSIEPITLILITNCQTVFSCLLPHCINYKFICLST